MDDAGLVQVDASYYPALPAALFSQVTVRVYEREIEILDARGELLRRHDKSARKGGDHVPALREKVARSLEAIARRATSNQHGLHISVPIETCINT